MIPYFTPPSTDDMPTLLNADGHIDYAGMRRRAVQVERAAFAAHVRSWYEATHGAVSDQTDVWRAAARAIAERSRHNRLARQRAGDDAR